MKEALKHLAVAVKKSSEEVYSFEKLVNFLDSLDWGEIFDTMCFWFSTVKQSPVAITLEIRIIQIDEMGYLDQTPIRRPLMIECNKKKYYLQSKIECSVPSVIVKRLVEDKFNWLEEPIEITPQSVDEIIKGLNSFQQKLLEG